MCMIKIGIKIYFIFYLAEMLRGRLNLELKLIFNFVAEMLRV
jgi:hypothetical protein